VKTLGDIKKTAVFVNAAIYEVLDTCKRFGMDYVQLHGDEPPGIIQSLKDEGLGVIKAFRIEDGFNWEVVDAYHQADLFLMDTASPSFGGSGKKFNWELLAGYGGDTPFLLSGGIGPRDVQQIKEIGHARLLGIDLNSGVESRPGLKSARAIENIIKNLRNE
jgi:phosphoribosylanthranilate isomerase